MKWHTWILPWLAVGAVLLGIFMVPVTGNEYWLLLSFGTWLGVNGGRNIVNLENFYKEKKDA